MTEANESKIILIAGGTASGKTTLASSLLKALGNSAVLISLDSYYRAQHEKPMSERIKTNYDHPDSLELDLLSQHLARLAQGGSVSIPIYDFASHNRDLNKTEPVLSKPIIIVEGILALWPETFRKLANFSTFVDAPADVRFARRLARDVAERGRTEQSVKAQWPVVESMYQQFCAPTKAFAGHVVDGTLPLGPSLEKILTLIVTGHYK